MFWMRITRPNIYHLRFPSFLEARSYLYASTLKIAETHSLVPGPLIPNTVYS